MQPFGISSTFLAFSIATYIASRGVKQKSLSPTGAVAAWVVGFLSVSSGLRGFVLLIFYKVGTAATKYRKDLKQKKDASAAESSVRGPSQVLACSAIAVGCSMAHVLYYGEEKAIDFDKWGPASSLTCAIIAHHATCLADTLASELGILALEQPFFVNKPWIKVPPGTNGGITLAGTFWSGIGGVIIGFSTVLMDVISGLEVRPLATILFGLICGLLGSFLDSLLGATVQATYYDDDKKLVYGSKAEASTSVRHISGFDLLSNSEVNLASVSATTAIGGILLGPYIFHR